MKVTTVSEALEMDDGMPIQCLAGTIKKSFKPTEGTKGDKPWTKQDVFITDGKAEIKVKLWNQTRIETAHSGKKVYFQATQNDKHQWNGVKVMLNEWKGVTSKEVDVSAAAEMGFGDMQNVADPAAPASQPSPAPQAPAAQAVQPAPQPAARQASQAKPQEGQPEHIDTPEEKHAKRLKAVRNLLEKCGQMRNAAKLCMMTAKLSKDDYMEINGKEMPNEQYQGLTGTYLIDCLKSPMAWQLPYGDLEKYMPEKKPTVLPKAA